MNSNYALRANLIVVGILLTLVMLFWTGPFYIVQPGHRGVLVTLGKADTQFKPEGMGFKMPFISQIVQIPVRQQSAELSAPCFSSDLQQIVVKLRILYRYPEQNIVKLYTQFQDVFNGIIAPKAQETIKEVTALRSAEQIVKTREEVKKLAFVGLKQKMENLLVIEDVIIENIDLSSELEKAIEQKMVQEQEAGRAKFAQQQTQIEAETARIRAQGEADAIRTRSLALQKDPQIIELMIVEKWNGVSPLVVGGDKAGANILLPINSKH